MSRNINTLPVEMLEHVLLSLCEDQQYILCLVCKLWQAIIQDWRRRKRLPVIISTPISLLVQNQSMLEWGMKLDLPSDRYLSIAVASSGNVKMMKWLYNQRVFICPSIDTYAASNGHLDFIKWAESVYIDISPQACVNAASNNHIHILRHVYADPFYSRLDDENTERFALTF